jgi:hypothetical protein
MDIARAVTGRITGALPVIVTPGTPRYCVEIDGSRYRVVRDSEASRSIGKPGYREGDLVTVSLTAAGMVAGIVKGDGARCVIER